MNANSYVKFLSKSEVEANSMQPTAISNWMASNTCMYPTVLQVNCLGHLISRHRLKMTYQALMSYR